LTSASGVVDATVQDQNILGCRVQFETGSTGGDIGVNVTFPQFMTGTFVVSWSVRFYDANGVPTGANGSTTQSVYGGSVTEQRNFLFLEPNNEPSMQTANNMISAQLGQYLQSDNAMNVRPVTNGQDNTWSRYYSITTAWSTVSTAVEIRQVNDTIVPLFTEANGTKLLVGN